MQAIQLDIVDSTNEEAKRRIRAGEITEPSYILARQQTAGKGSRGRTWISPRDAGIYLTVVDFCPNGLPADVTDLTRAVAVAGAKSLVELGLKVRIKPPNDLLVDGKKLGGILVEVIVCTGCPTALVTGIGINSFDASRPQADDQRPITSVERELNSAQFSAIDWNCYVAQLVVVICMLQRQVLQGQSVDISADWASMLL